MNGFYENLILTKHFWCFWKKIMIVLKKDYENETNIIYSLNDKLKITITEYFCGQQILFFF